MWKFISAIAIVAVPSTRAKFQSVSIIKPRDGDVAVELPLAVSLNIEDPNQDAIQVCYETSAANRRCVNLVGGSLYPLIGLKEDAHYHLSAYLTDAAGDRVSEFSAVSFRTATKPPPSDFNELESTGLVDATSRLLHSDGVSAYHRGNMSSAASFFQAAAAVLPNSASYEGAAASLFGGGEYSASADTFLAALEVENSIDNFRNMRTARDWDLAERLLKVDVVRRTDPFTVVLVSTFFRGSDRYSADRFNEIVAAQTANLENPVVGLLVLVADMERDCDPSDYLPRAYHHKLRLVQQSSDGIPTWGELLRAGSGFPGRAVVFAHADIAFFAGTSNLNLVQRFLLDGTEAMRTLDALPRPVGLAVTRRPFDGCLWKSGGGHGLYDLPVDLCAGPHGNAEGVVGFDAYGLVSPAPEALVRAADSLPVNKLGADLKMLEAMLMSDFLVYDPCVFVVATHMHCTRERTYSFADDLVSKADVERGRYSGAVRASGSSFAQALRRDPPVSSVLPASSEWKKIKIRPAVVVAFPFSGEDWLRAELDRLGIKTGSTEFDAERAATFPYEGQCDGVDVIFSTALPNPIGSIRRRVSPLCSRINHKSIVLIRDPFDTIVEAYLWKQLTHRNAHLYERNRDVSSNIRHRTAEEVARSHFNKDDSNWNAFAVGMAKFWHSYYLPLLNTDSKKLVSLHDLQNGGSFTPLSALFGEGTSNSFHGGSTGPIGGYSSSSFFNASLRAQVFSVVSPVVCALQLPVLDALECPSHGDLHKPPPGLEDSASSILDQECVQNASPSRCIVAFSLYGDHERYIGGALANARDLHKVLPHFRMRLYHDNSVRAEVIWSLKVLGVECVNMTQTQSHGQLRNGRTWRFSAASDPAVSRYLIRDVDSRITRREATAVYEWVLSGLDFHIMRDHPSHSIYAKAGFAMQAGMWAGKSSAVPHMVHMLRSADSSQEYIADQVFLRDYIYPLTKGRAIIHDSFSCHLFPDARPFPAQRANPEEFVGSVILGSGFARSDDVRSLLDSTQPETCVDRAL